MHGQKRFRVKAQGGSPVIIPVQAVCGELELDGSPRAAYETRINVTFRPGSESAEVGEIVVSPGILAGEVNPGETIVIPCDDILMGRASFAGIITVQVFPAEGFTVRVTYQVQER